MTPPASSATTATPVSTAAAANPPPPPAQPAAPAAPTSASPYRFQLSGGYTSLSLGNGAPTYSGGLFQANVGQSFTPHPNHHLFVNGVFRLGSLNNAAGENIQLVHFGLETGYELWLAPRIFSLFTYVGLGSNILHSDQASVAPGLTRSLDNQSMFALTLGGGMTLGNGIFVLSGGYQPNFGLNVPVAEEGPTRGFNPQAWFVNFGIDVARLVDWAGGNFPREVNAENWFKGITPALIVDTSYTYNFGRPSDGTNQLRVFGSRWDRPMFNYAEVSLDRAVDAENPFGFRFDFGVGENAAGARARSSFSGDWYDLQQVYARIRLPIGRGVVINGGKFTMPIGNEVIESPLNNHISHSFQFLYGQPFTGTGVTAQYGFNDDHSLTLGFVNGWDNVLDHSSGLAGLLAYTANWTPQFSTSLAGTVGNEGGRLRSEIDVIATLKPVDGLSFAANYDWGHEEAGAGLPASNWHALSLTGRYDFNRYFGISARGEVFEDAEGSRTGLPQTLGSVTGTVHVMPFPWLRLRTEIRHDASSNQPFMAGKDPAGTQTTLGFGASAVF